MSLGAGAEAGAGADAIWTQVASILVFAPLVIVGARLRERNSAARLES